MGNKIGEKWIGDDYFVFLEAFENKYDAKEYAKSVRKTKKYNYVRVLNNEVWVSK